MLFNMYLIRLLIISSPPVNTFSPKENNTPRIHYVLSSIIKSLLNDYNTPNKNNGSKVNYISPYLVVVFDCLLF